MHAAVVIRNVVDCRVPLPADIYLEKPLAEGQVSIINPSDWGALEQAMTLKLEGLLTKITVINLGPSDGEESLGWCLAHGADAAQRLWDSNLEEADQLGKGKALAAALQRLQVELVFSGDGCLDQLDSLMPGIAAGIAGMAYVTEIEQAEKVSNGQAIVIRRREKGKRERMAVQLPAFLAITQTGSIASERAGLDDTLSAFTQKIDCWDLQDLGLAADTIGGRGARITKVRTATHKPPLTKPLTPDFRQLAEERLRSIISGGAVRKQGKVVTGTPEELVEKISEFLRGDPVMRL